MGNKQKGHLVIFVSSVSRLFGLVERLACAMKENIKNKNFEVHALKTKQVGNVFSFRGSQENPTLVKYSNGGR